jgi:hypothetical protein
MPTMRAEHLLFSALLLCAAPAQGGGATASEPSEDERAVLLATRGEPYRKPHSETVVPASASPPELDGAELQAWFDRRHGVNPVPASDAYAASTADIDDADAEAALLRDIERRRRD